MKRAPETALRYLIREIDKLNAKDCEKFKNKWTDVEIDAFSNLQVGDTEGIKVAYESVFTRIQ